MSNLSDLFPSSGGVVVDKQTFTASGTWTKPASALPSDIVIVDLWGGGGSGGIRATTTDTTTGSPGAGGAHNRVEMRVGDLNATESVTVGAGGVSVTATSSSGTTNGNAGGFSDFKGYRAYGGGYGGSASSDFTQCAAGGGIFSPPNFNGSSGRLGGAPRALTSRTLDKSSTDFTQPTPLLWTPGEWGGGGTYLYNLEEFMRPIHGGAAGLTVEGSTNQGVTDPVWRSSIWGGAAGGGYFPSYAGTQTGGTSQFGGNGGSVAIPASNTSNVNGGNGSARGGGGSGGKWGSTGTVTSGAGGRGEVVITIIRGG